MNDQVCACNVYYNMKLVTVSDILHKKALILWGCKKKKKIAHVNILITFM